MHSHRVFLEFGNGLLILCNDWDIILMECLTKRRPSVGDDDETIVAIQYLFCLGRHLLVHQEDVRVDIVSTCNAFAAEVVV